jgi:hypothetical protein
LQRRKEWLKKEQGSEYLNIEVALAGEKMACITYDEKETSNI